MILLSGGGCLIKIVGAVVGLAACGAAMMLGLKDVRAGGAGCIAWGVTVILLSRRDPRTRDGKLPGWGILVAGAGIATFLWPAWFNEQSRVKEQAKSATDKLSASLASGSHPIAESKAGAYRLSVLEFEKQAGLSGKVSVRVELDGPDPAAVKKASIFVETDRLRDYGNDRKKALAERLIKLLQADFPKAACNAAVRGPFQWGVQATSPSPGQAPSVTLGSEKPAF